VKVWLIVVLATAIISFGLSAGFVRAAEKGSQEVVVGVERKEIVLIQKDVILTLSGLPTESVIAPFDLENATFHSVALSPQGNLVAFSVKGKTHDWLGLYDIQKKNVTEISFLYGGDAGELSWSPDGHYLAAEAIPASGIRTILVIDSTDQKIIATLPQVSGDGEKIAEVFQPWWSKDGEILHFKATRTANEAPFNHQLLLNSIEVPGPHKK
jgi:WD40 repeat protein